MGAVSRRRLIACGLLVAGCGDNYCAGVQDLGVRGHISVATTSATAGFATTFAGTAGQDIGRIAIDAGVGTIAVRGSDLVAVAVGYATDWPQRGDSLNTVVAASDAELGLAWLYCHGTSLYHVYYEGTDGSLFDDVDATGSCALDPAAVTATAELAPLELDFPLIDHGFQIAGPEVTFDAVNPGEITVAGVTRTLLPFAAVDCSSCSSGDTHGWQELHALLWNSSSRDLGIGIFYFFAPGQVVLASPTIELPSWSAEDGAVFDATWRACH